MSNKSIAVTTQQLQRLGLEVVWQSPLIVRCLTCGAEWHPKRPLAHGTSSSDWYCLKGCHAAKK